MLIMADTKAELSIDASNLHTSNSSGNASSQPNNPLSRKLNKILETRLDNDKVCDSLFVFANFLDRSAPGTINCFHVIYNNNNTKQTNK